MVKTEDLKNPPPGVPAPPKEPTASQAEPPPPAPPEAQRTLDDEFEDTVVMIINGFTGDRGLTIMTAHDILNRLSENCTYAYLNAAVKRAAEQAVEREREAHAVASAIANEKNGKAEAARVISIPEKGADQ